MAEIAEVEHHHDCPAPYFPDHPERCRCAILEELDRPDSSTTECICCKVEFQEGDRCVRVERVVRNEPNVPLGTEGWSSPTQQFVCLDCLTPPFKGEPR